MAAPARSFKNPKGKRKFKMGWFAKRGDPVIISREQVEDALKRFCDKGGLIETLPEEKARQNWYARQRQW